MHTLSTRDLAALAYERGQEFDPALTPTPELMEELAAAAGASAIVCGPGPYERRLHRLRERRALERVPDWFSPCDLVDRSLAGARQAVVHGEPV